MTKIDIISGFLGAGKTTLIKRLLADALKGEKVVLIENEFGEIGIGGGVLSLHPDVAVERIRAGAKEAVEKAHKCKVPMPDHFDSQIRFREHKLAYSKSFYPGATLEEGKTVCFSTDDWYEMLRFYHFVLSDG